MTMMTVFFKSSKRDLLDTPDRPPVWCVGNTRGKDRHHRHHRHRCQYGLISLWRGTNGPWDAGSWESLMQRCRSPCMRSARPVKSTRRRGSKPASSKTFQKLEGGFYVDRQV